MRLWLLGPWAFGLFLSTQTPSSNASIAGGQIEALGVCDVRPESVACWNMDGVASPDLAQNIRAALSNGNEVGFRLGKKNRYLAVRQPQNLYLNFSAPGNDSLYSNLSLNGDPKTALIHIVAEPSASSITIKAKATVPSPADQMLSLREGTKEKLESWNLEVGASQRLVPKKGASPGEARRFNGSGNLPPNVDYWNVVVGLSGGDNEYVNWVYIPLDASGDPIRFVDGRGRPISAIKALELEPNLPANGYNGNYSNGADLGSAKKPKAMAAILQGGGTAPGFRLTTNIDPKWIANVRVRTSHQESVDLGPFPLDPR